MSKKPENNTTKLLQDFRTLSEEMETLMQEFFGENQPRTFSAARGFAPPLDFFETETEFACLIELAGVAPQDLDVELNGSSLSVAGARREIPGFEQRRYHKMELDFGAFERTLSFPESVDPNSLRVENLGGFYLIRLKKTVPGLKTGPDYLDPVSPDPRR